MQRWWPARSSGPCPPRARPPPGASRPGSPSSPRNDEYLQTATENGLIGLGLVGTALVALAVAGLRARTVTGAAATAAVAGFAAHSAFDFLWHIPVLPLLLAVATAVLLTDAPLRSEGVLLSDGALRSNREDVP